MTRLVRMNEPRKRMRRALRQVRAGERTEEGLDLPFGRRRSQVEARSRARQSRLERRSPTRTVATSFLVLIAIGTGLLLLPPMHSDGHGASVVTALFTATSAICVTGLNVVDPSTFWSGLGKATILLLIQVGGFGIQALGTLWILLLTKRIGATSRLATMAETGTLTPGDVRRALTALGVITVFVELVIATLLGLRFWIGYDYGLGKAAWYGLFHAVSAFNNAGFALASDSLMGVAGDPLIILPLSAAVIIGSLGFLVVVELVSRATGGRGLLPRRAQPELPSVSTRSERLRRRATDLAQTGSYSLSGADPEMLGMRNPVPLSLHTRLMLMGTGGMMVVGMVGFAVLEWRNPATLMPMSLPTKLLNAFFSGAVTPRSAGFNTVDYARVETETRFLTGGLMFIGGGSGSTAGGIKITTLMVLLAAALAEVRGRRDVDVMDRRIPDTTVRVALSVFLVSLFAVMGATMLLLIQTSLTLDEAMFEVIAALATAGLTAGVTPTLETGSQLLLVALMFLGRVGPLTLASSLTLNDVHRSYRLPAGRPMIG